MATKKRKLTEEKIGFHTELLPVRLTDEEMLERGQALARIHREIGEHESHADSVKSELKSKRAALDTEASRLAGIVQRKAEPRPVSVTHWALWKTRHYQEVREDTGEVVPGSFRPLREEEKQGDLFKAAAEVAKNALDQSRGPEPEPPAAKKGKKKPEAEEPEDEPAAE